MLTPDEMARIEEEERKRHAEEQYRQDVRGRLTQPQPDVKSGFSALKVVGLVVLCAILAVVLLNTNFRSASADAPRSISTTPSRPAAAHYVPKTDQIASGQVVVPHGKVVWYKVTITSEMMQPSIVGDFTASGGHGNDVAAIIANESDFTNWSNGHQAKAFWSTQGTETTGSFNVRLNPGTYYLAFSNKFSAFSDKYVSLNASLNYQHAESE